MAVAVKKQRETKPKDRKVKRLNTTETGKPKWIRVADFAAHFRMSISGVHKAIEAGTIKTIPVPGTGKKAQRRIPWSEVERIEAGKPLKSAATGKPTETVN